MSTFHFFLISYDTACRDDFFGSSIVETFYKRAVYVEKKRAAYYHFLNIGTYTRIILYKSIGLELHHDRE